jgi:predicted ribosome quality control (RQC) complex YloA/Tae2 family protein
MVVQLSSLDLHFLMSELNVLVGGKIDKIFQSKETPTFLFSFHISNTGKKALLVNLPSTLCLADFKPEFPTTPPGFCSALRKKLTSARLTNISQLDFQRVLLLEFSTKHGNSYLYIELFSTGNLILVDETKKILTMYKTMAREEQLMKPGQTYTLPSSQINTLTITEKEFENIINSSNKESLVKTLAIDLSLGGTYSEEVLFNSKIDKNSSPKNTKEKEIKILFKEMQKLLNSQICPQIYSNNLISPIKLNHIKTTESKSNSFNETINELIKINFQNKLTDEENKDVKEKTTKVDKILKAQKNQLETLDKTQLENQKKGEAIYSNYSEIDQILKQISSLKKHKTWKEIKEELKSNKLFVSLNEHDGTLILDLK